MMFPAPTARPFGSCLPQFGVACFALSLFYPAHSRAANTLLEENDHALFANHASYIDNANTEPQGQLDAEYDVTYAYTRHSDYLEHPLSLTYGIAPRWDATVSLGGEWQSYHPEHGRSQSQYGLGDLPINNKVNLLDQEHFWASQSVEFYFKVPTASRARGLGTGRPDFDLTWLATRNLTDRFTVDLNLGYSWMGSGVNGPLSNQLHYGAGFEYAAADRLSFIGQVFTSAAAGTIYRTEVASTVGVAYQFTPRFSMHASLTKGFGSRMIDISGTVGVVWTFGAKSLEPSTGE